MKKPLVAMAAMAFMTVTMAGPVAAQELKSAGASAYGAQISGTLALLPPTPSVNVTEVPGTDTKTTLGLPVDPVVNSGTLTASGTNSVTATLPATVPGTALVGSTGAVPAAFNSRAFARVEGLKVLSTPNLGGGTTPAPCGPTSAAVCADVVQSEALVVCNGSTPTFAGSSQTVGLKIGSTDVPLVGDLVNTVINLVNNVTNPTGLLSIKQDEKGVVGGKVFFNALHITVLGSVTGTALLDVTVAHSEVSGAVCGPGAPPASVGPTLATTGGNSSFFDFGASLLLGSLVLMLVLRKGKAAEVHARS